MLRTEIEKGDKVVVVRGRKVPAGTEGVVFWSGVTRAGYCRTGMKVEGMGDLFIATPNLERVIPEEEVAAERERVAEEEAKARAKKERFEALEAKLGLAFECEESVKEDMGGYGGSNTYDVPYAGDGTDEEFAEYIDKRFPRTSSWGALRWCTGASVVSIDREAKMVRYSVGYWMCD